MLPSIHTPLVSNFTVKGPWTWIEMGCFFLTYFVMFEGGKIVYDMNIYFNRALGDMKFCSSDHEGC